MITLHVFLLLTGVMCMLMSVVQSLAAVVKSQHLSVDWILCGFRMINALKMGEHMKKWAKKLSGGTRRKVRTLIQ